MKIYFNGFYDGFFDKSNPGTTIIFFIKLFNKIYDNDDIIIGNIDDSDILCEFDMLINTNSKVKYKKWLHTYLFNGEWKCICDKNNYDCVLFGEKNNNNIINLPLYISYMESNNINLNQNKIRYDIPSKDICVIISNPNGKIRNNILEKLEKHFKIDYLGDYKNNIGYKINDKYNSENFKKKISEYKFIISMENNRQETYITEKIILGLNAQIIPIYWGSLFIHDYINKERIITCLSDNDNDLNNIINKINDIKNNDQLWLNIINKPCYPNNNEFRNINDVSTDVKNLLYNNLNNISKVYCISNPIYELNNYNWMINTFNKLNLKDYNYKFICPTYKTTISDNFYDEYNLTINKFPDLLNRKIKKSEFSLIINYKSILENIIKNYNSGTFLIFESDIVLYKDINKLNKFLKFISKYPNHHWDFIHLGQGGNIFSKPSINFFKNYENNNKYIEDITDINSEFRIIRKLHTRCADSMLWNYKGILNFLNYMNNNYDYNIPFDYYIIKYLETNNNIKHYWSLDNFFMNGSNNGYLKTTIQNDI